MGCDIHVCPEVRRNGEWQPHLILQKDQINEDPYNISYYKRDYVLFGVLAAVRRSYSFSLLPRGIPDDASSLFKTAERMWDDDCHSHSWITLNELKLKCIQLTISPDPHASTALQSLKAFIRELDWPDDAEIEDCRVLFFFDN